MPVIVQAMVDPTPHGDRAAVAGPAVRLMVPSSTATASYLPVLTQGRARRAPRRHPGLIAKRHGRFCTVCNIDLLTEAPHVRGRLNVTFLGGP